MASAGQVQIDVSANIAKFKSAMDKAAHEGNQLNKKLTRSMRGVQKAMRGLGAIAGTVVAGSFAMMAKQSLNSADEIQKLSQRLGASTEALSQYRHVADLSGVSFQTLTMGFQRMGRRVAEAAQGTGEAKNAIAELGLSAVELNKLKPEQQFEVLADALIGVESSSDRTRLAMKLFDSEGVSLLQTMQNGSAGIREMRDEADQLGKTITQDMADGAAQANDAMTRLSASIGGSVTQSILTYSDEIKYAADLTAEYLPKAIGFLIDIFKGLKATVQFVIGFVIDRIHDFLSTLSGIPIVGKYFDGMRDSVGMMGEVMDDQLESNIASMGKWKDGAQEIEKQNRKVEASFNASTGEISTNTGALLDNARASFDFKKAYKEADKRISQASKTFGEASDMLDEMRKGQEDLGDTVTTVRGLWERANDSMFNSLQSFFSSGLKDTKAFSQNLKDTFKDMIASILAEITRLIASNVFKKFLGFISDGKLGDSSTGIFDGLGSIFGKSGTPSSGGETGGIESIGSIFSGVTKIFGKSGSIGKMFSQGGFFGSGGTMAKTFSSLGGSFSSLATTVPYIALAAAVVEAGGPVFYQGIKKLLGGGARTPQELGEDQLRAVDEATKAGRNTQVALGSVGGVATSFLGGFDENSTFFGVDLAKEQLQKVGDILTKQFGFNQALALKDGVIRLEDFSRKFSENNDQIVAEVQASIAMVQLDFLDAEKAKLGALGDTLTAFDAAYDSMADTGLSTADKLTKAYMFAFETTEDVAKNAIDNIGIGAERMGSIFDTVSGNVLSTMSGTFNSIEGRIESVNQNAQASANRIGRNFNNQIDSAGRRVERLNERLIDQLKTVVENQNASTAQNQPLFGT